MHASKRRRLSIFAILWTLYALLCLPGIWWPGYFDSALGLVLIAPLLSVYLFSMIGVPGLLDNNGLCGWGWCAPSLFGWIFTLTFCLITSWLIACGIERISRRSRE
jgi:hypothetical protein